MFNSQGHIATGTLRVEEPVHTSWSRFFTVNNRASTNNYQFANMKCPGRDLNRQPQRLKASATKMNNNAKIGQPCLVPLDKVKRCTKYTLLIVHEDILVLSSCVKDVNAGSELNYRGGKQKSHSTVSNAFSESINPNISGVSFSLVYIT